MIASLFLATAIVTATVVIHFAGLLALLRMLGSRGHGFRAHESTLGQGALIVSVVLGLFAIHTVEIWLYAVAYLAIGAVAGFETALYFSTTSFASIGYGDIVLDNHWRLVSAIEGVNGLILIGWSTAFLLSLMTRLRSLEHDWLERGPENGKPH
jgi:hypothetical protein